MPIFYVYLIINKTTNKKYIGSKICYKEIPLHDGYWGSSKYLNKDYNLYGKDNFSKEIIADHYQNKKDLIEGESYYMLKYNTLEPNGYNRFLPNTKMGFYTMGLHLSEKTKDKISKSLSGKKKKGRKSLTDKQKEHLHNVLVGRNKGIAIPERLKEKMRKPHKSFSEDTKNKMRKPKSVETRKNMSLSKLGKKCETISKIQLGKKRGNYKKHIKNKICPHCSRSISSNMYSRWHGDKCIFKIADK